jgi:hypothetical protein
MRALRHPVSRAAAALALVAAGCLAKPARPTDDLADAGPADADTTGTDSGADAGPSCAGGEEPGSLAATWPAGTLLGHQAQVVRLDDDCRDDAVLFGRLGGSGTHGIFVALGRPTGFLSGYDEVLLTPSNIVPLAIDVADVLGDDHVDIAVLADDADGEAVLLVYEGQGGTSFGAPLSRVATGVFPSGTLAEPHPQYVRVARTGPGVRGLVYGGLHAMSVLPVTDWTLSGFRAAIPVPLPGTGSGLYVQGVVPVPSARADTDDFLVVLQQSARWLEAVGDGTWRDRIGVTFGNEQPRFAIFADVDGDGTTDAVGAGPFDLDVVLTTYPGAGDPALDGRVFTPFPDLGDMNPDGLAVRDLGAGPAPELVVLDAEATDPSQSWLRIYDDVAAQGAGAIGPSTRGGDDDYVSTIAVAQRLVVGDFDGDGRVDIVPYRVEPTAAAPFCYRALPHPTDGYFCVALCGGDESC